MKAKFYAFDANGKQARPNASELKITENGIERKIVSVSCAPHPPEQTVSIAISIDVSGSMIRGSFSDIPVEMGKTTATTLCNQVVMPPSEFALQICNDKAYIVQDFTTDKNKVLNAILPIKAGGSNDFVEHLLNPKTGLLNIVKKGKHKRVAILYTDAWWSPLTIAELKQCIDTCLTYKIEFYAVIYSRPEEDTNGIKKSLAELAHKTGGRLYDGIFSNKAAEFIAHDIQQLTQGAVPCEIVWQSGVSCSVGTTNGRLQWNNQGATIKYLSPFKVSANLTFTPLTIYCKNKPIGVRFDTTIALRANNSDFKVMSIVSTDPQYSIVPQNFFLQAGQSQTLTISYTPNDSNYTLTTIEVLSDLCPQTFFISGGYVGKKLNQTSLKLISPNGGEEFLIGSDTAIKWSGVTTMDTVLIEYSIDNGILWNTIKDKADKLMYSWKNIPKPQSRQCLVRVKCLNGDTSSIIPRSTLGVAWSPDGTKVATTDNAPNKTIKIWDVNTNTLLQTLVGHTNAVFCISWSPDGTQLLSGADDGTARIWDSNTGVITQIFSGHSWWVRKASWSPDGTKIVTSGWDDTSAKIWDVASGKEIRLLSGHNQVMSVAWSPDGTKIITGGRYDSLAKIWDASTGSLLHTLLQPVGVLDVKWSPDSRKVLTVGSNREANIWDANNGTLLHNLSGHSDYVTCGGWSPDGTKVATGSWDRTIRIWNASTGVMIRTLITATNINDAAWSPEGSRLASSEFTMVKIWNLDSLAQSDVSDAVFSIVAPSLASQDIDMGQCLVGKNKDSLITSFVQEKGGYQCRVDSIAIVGAEAMQFRLASGIPPFVVPANGSHAVEFRFTPTSPGIKTATVLVFTQSGDTLRQTIRGEGVQPTLAVINDVIDFGQIEIGKTKDSLQAVTIKNIGTAPLDITATHHAGPNDKDYTTLAGGGAFSLTPNEERRMDLRFLPSAIGRTSGRLLFDYNGVGSPATVQLFGVGLGGNIALSNDSAYVGEKAAIRIELLNNVKPTTQSGGKIPFRARISSPSFIYLPQDATNVQSTSNGLSFDVERQWDGLGQTLGTFTAKASLGAVEKTDLILEDFAWLNSDGSILSRDVELQNGSFTVLGICYQGGARLLNTQGNVQLLVVQPHPVQNSNAEVEIETVEKGITTLSLYDLTGREIAVIIHREFERGTHRVALNTSDIPSGSYILILQTPTERKAQRMEILH